jgi:hypothetical protein
MKTEDIEVKHCLADGLYAKKVRIPAGNTLAQHMHIYSHLSILASGVAVVEVDGVSTEYVGPCDIFIAAMKHHAVTAKTESTWYCIHATTETDLEEVDGSYVSPLSTTETLSGAFPNRPQTIVKEVT